MSATAPHRLEGDAHDNEQTLREVSPQPTPAHQRLNQWSVATFAPHTQALRA